MTPLIHTGSEGALMHCPCRPEPYNHVAESIFSEAKKMFSGNKAYPVPPCKRAPAQLSS